MGARRHACRYRKIRYVVGFRQAIVHHRPGQQLSRVVIHTLFVKRLADALGYATVYLTIHDHRVDDAPEIIAGRESDHVHDAGIGVDFDFANVAAGRKSKVLGIVKCGFLESRFQRFQRIVVRHVRSHGDVAERNGSVSAGDT